MNSLSRTVALVGLFAVLGLVAFVSWFPRSETVDGVFMARSIHSYGGVHMQALLRGRLEARQGCLVVAPDSGVAPSIVVWAREFSLRRDGDGLAIFDGDERVVALGELVAVAGGEIDAQHVADLVRAQIPSDCRRSLYWFGNVVQRAGQ